MKNLIKKLWTIIKPFLTWRILVCYLPVYFISTGWAYIASVFARGWLQAFAISWLAFLWMPFCPEKLITIPITIWLHKKLFPNHSTAQLDEVLEKERQSLDKRKHK